MSNMDFPPLLVSMRRNLERGAFPELEFQLEFYERRPGNLPRALAAAMPASLSAYADCPVEMGGSSALDHGLLRVSGRYGLHSSRRRA